MKAYTLHTISNHGRHDMHLVSDSLEELKHKALARLAGLMSELEEHEELSAFIYHTSDLESRLYWITAIFCFTVSNDGPLTYKVPANR